MTIAFKPYQGMDFVSSCSKDEDYIMTTTQAKHTFGSWRAHRVPHAGYLGTMTTGYYIDDENLEVICEIDTLGVDLQKDYVNLIAAAPNGLDLARSVEAWLIGITHRPLDAGEFVLLLKSQNLIAKAEGKD